MEEFAVAAPADRGIELLLGVVGPEAALQQVQEEAGRRLPSALAPSALQIARTKGARSRAWRAKICLLAWMSAAVNSVPTGVNSMLPPETVTNPSSSAASTNGSRSSIAKLRSNATSRKSARPPRA